MTDKELLHEIEMSRAATAAIRESIKKAQDKKYLSSIDFGRDFIRKFVIPFAEALVEATSTTSRGRVTARNQAIAYKSMQEIFSRCEANVISAISIKSILDSLGVAKYDKPRTVEAASFIGQRIEDEVRTNYNIELGGDDVRDYISKELSTKTSTPRFRRLGAKKGAERILKDKGWFQDDFYPSWSRELRIRVGLFILEVAKKLGWVTQDKRFVKKHKTQGFIDLSQEVQAQFKIYQAELESYSILTYPLIDLPREWEVQEGPAWDNFSGGYYHEWIRKQYRLNNRYNSETEFAKDAIDLLNTLGRTAWNIDKDVYDIAKDCLEKGFTIGSLKAVFHDPRIDQDMPEDIAALPQWDKRRVDWRKERSMLHTALAESKRKNVRSRNALYLASIFLTKPRFYLSWSCDYRGRMYTQQSLLHRQASDVEKALVTFSDGCKLDKRGEYWASQAIGSAYLGSKAGYEERAKWTYENKELIKAIAEDPVRMSSKWDEEVADNPWQFLQLCLEWNRVVLKEEKHLWDVPISADASASGLQLLSAMRRDDKGMYWSNLFPAKSSSAPPQDAYMEVIRVAVELANKNPETAWMSKYIKNRKLGKAILMKKIYGASLQTNRADVKAALIEDGFYPAPFSYKEANKLTTLLTVASEVVFPKAFEALDWILKLYKAAKKNGSESFSWETPTYDSIHLIEQNSDTVLVTTSHLGNVTIGTGLNKKPDYLHMKGALCPSFVHSYDAAVLKASFKQWKKPLAVIHDCINVLPNDMESAMDRVKKGFVHVCDGDPLAKLAEDLGVSDKQLKRLPQGKADLADVLESTYMLN